jgi:hypothetical protein
MKFAFIGAADNWMDFRDQLIKTLEGCDTELKLEKLLTALLLSISAGDPKTINKTRKAVGLPGLTEEEAEKIRDAMEEQK